MKTILFITSLLVTIFSLSCNSSDKINKDYKDGKTTVRQFSDYLKSDPKVQLVDVRTADEYKESHIDNAVNIDYFSSDFKKNLLSHLKKDEKVLVYCKSGGRSGKTYQLLKGEGFSEVYDLDGGMKAWSKQLNQ